MSKRIKILINTDSATLHSGLAETTRNIFIPLLERYPDKYEIHQCGWFHLTNREQVPWPIYPTIIKQTPQGPQVDHEDRYGQKTLSGLIEKIKPDIVFGYGDLWTFDHILDSPIRNQFRLIIYYTVDGQPYFGHLEGDKGTTWGKQLARADKIVTLSHFGKDTLLDGLPEIKNKDISVRYHPLALEMYPSKTEEQVQDMRSHILPPAMARDTFLCGWLGRNQFRKQNFKLWELLHYMVYGDYIECKDCGRITTKEWNHSAGKSKVIGSRKQTDILTLYDMGYDYSHCWHCKSENIQEGVPDEKFYMWFHMSKNDPGYNPDLHERMWNVANRSIYTNNTNGLVGVSKQDVANLLSCWDMMFYPSGGEGFGNPPFEAMAAGCPVAFSNYSSHAEFARFGGLPVNVTYQPEMHHGIMRASVDTNHAVQQVLRLRRDKKLRKALGQRGKNYVAQYSTAHMVDPWNKVFTEAMEKPLPVEGDTLYAQSV